MATANPEDADITCKNSECPKKVFQWKTILGHIARAKDCKIFYSDAEIQTIRENSKEMQKINKAKKRDRDNSNTPGESSELLPSTSGTKGKKIEPKLAPKGIAAIFVVEKKTK